MGLQDLQADLEAQADAQFRREDLRWIDVPRFPTEPADARSVDFQNAPARDALDAFRDQYARSTPLRCRIARPRAAPQIQSALRAPATWTAGTTLRAPRGSSSCHRRVREHPAPSGR